jgi:hypothetical protein
MRAIVLLALLILSGSCQAQIGQEQLAKLAFLFKGNNQSIYVDMASLKKSQDGSVSMIVGYTIYDNPQEYRNPANSRMIEQLGAEISTVIIDCARRRSAVVELVRLRRQDQGNGLVIAKQNARFNAFNDTRAIRDYIETNGGPLSIEVHQAACSANSSTTQSSRVRRAASANEIVEETVRVTLEKIRFETLFTDCSKAKQDNIVVEQTLVEIRNTNIALCRKVVAESGGLPEWVDYCAGMYPHEMETRLKGLGERRYACVAYEQKAQHEARVLQSKQEAEDKRMAVEAEQARQDELRRAEAERMKDPAYRAARAKEAEQNRAARAKAEENRRLELKKSGMVLVCKGSAPEAERRRTIYVDCNSRIAVVTALENAWQELRRQKIAGATEDMCWNPYNKAKEMPPSVASQNYAASFLSWCNNGLQFIE